MKVWIQETGYQATACLDQGHIDLGHWDAALFVREMAEAGCKDCRLVVTAKQDVTDATITISHEEEGWSRENYVFAPAGMYQGNRFRSEPLEYPPCSVGVVDDVEDPEIVITDVPRLSKEGESKIELKAGDLTKPLFGYFSREKRKAFFFAFTQQSFSGRDNSIRVEETEDTAEFALVVPARRSKVYYFMNASMESHDRGADMAAGESATIRFRLYERSCESITEYLEQYTDLRKEFTEPSQFDNTVPFSKAFRAVENKYNIMNWMVRDEFYRSSNADHGNVCSQWQTGWVGGGMNTYPCLVTGTRLSKKRSMQTLDFIFREILTDTGLMYGIFYDGKPYGDALDPFRNQNQLLLRKCADAVYFILKQFLVLEKEGVELPEKWRTGLRKSLSALQEIFEVNRQFGQFVDVFTKKILARGTSSAGIAIGALALGSVFYKEKSLMETAVRAGEYYFHNYLEKGISNGGPGEICQCPDSESTFGLLESYIALYDVTGDVHWIPYAKAAANLGATWCVSYDFQFPAHTQFARRGIKATGAVWASIQNKHAGPGICTLSGVSLFKLYRATGEEKYLELFREISHNVTQFVSLDENPFQNTWGGCRYGQYSYEGQSGERVQLSDWEGAENVGEFPGGSCWCEVTIQLNYVENPGVYIVKDRDEVHSFDHVAATVVRANNDELVVELRNDTRYDATVTVFAENAAQQSRPMDVNPWDQYQKVQVPGGGKVNVVVLK